jgi:hypothetical protein
MAVRPGRAVLAVVATIALGAGALLLSSSPADAAPLPLPQVPQLAGNPNPGTDLFASTLAVLTGGTQRICNTSPLGIPVHCVEHLNVQPSLPPTASGTTYAHWIFCKVACVGSLMVHEMVHVSQFEQYGDLFGPMYLAEAAVHGSGCDNVWERPAYQTGGQCL